MKKSILILILILILPNFVFASGSWALMQNGSSVSLQGECDNTQVKIELFGKTDDNKPVYVKEVECVNGKFSFSKDFLQTDLPQGNYIVAVDDEKSQNVVALTKQKNNVSEKKVAANNMVSKTEDPETNFLAAFVSLQQSILDMRTWLAQTKYPDLFKKTVVVALNGVDLAVGKVSNLISDEENSDNFENKKIIEKQISAENLNVQTDAQLASSTTLPQEIVSNLSIVEASEIETNKDAKNDEITKIDITNAGLVLNQEAITE